MREGKPVKRVLLSVGRKPVVLTDCSEEVLMTADGVRSKWYTHLTHDFYL